MQKTGFIAALLAWAAMGCAGHGVLLGKDHPDSKILWTHRDQFVRIEPQERCNEATIKPNGHPRSLPADQLRAALASLRIDRPDDEKSVPVFSRSELDTLIGPLNTAFKRSGPGEDICVAIEGPHPGSFGYQRSITTARIFFQGGNLHVIFGKLHDPVDDYDTPLHIERTDRRLQPFEPGSRCTDGGGKFPAIVATALVRFYEQENTKRRNWLVVRLAEVPKPKESPPPSAQPPAFHSAPETALPEVKNSDQVPKELNPDALEPRQRSIEERLRVLKNLRDKELISEQEYIEKRRQILDSL